MILLLSRLLRALPLAWAMAIARGLSLVWYYLIPVRRRVARDNVARIYGQRLSAARQRQIVRGSFANACMYAVESLRMPGLTPALSTQLVRRHNMATIDGLLARGRGLIAVTAHIGNFDLCGTAQAVRGYPLHAIVKDVHWPPAQRFVAAVRAATGMGTLPPRGARAQILQLLAANQIVAFVIDQHMAAHRAIDCTFMGLRAATTPAPVRFALATGAPVVPVVLVRDPRDGYHHLIVEDEFQLEAPYAAAAANVQHNTQRLNEIVARWVHTWPEQWLWLHRRWKLQDRSDA